MPPDGHNLFFFKNSPATPIIKPVELDELYRFQYIGVAGDSPFSRPDLLKGRFPKWDPVALLATNSSQTPPAWAENVHSVHNFGIATAPNSYYFSNTNPRDQGSRTGRSFLECDTSGKIAITPRELRISTLTNNQTCGARRALQVSILRGGDRAIARGVIAIFPVVSRSKNERYSRTSVGATPLEGEVVKKQGG